MPVAVSDKTRVIRASLESKAGILLEEKAVSIIGTSQNFVKVGSSGTGFRGPQSHISIGMQRRRGGLWVEEFEMLGMIPKTIITPFPKILPMPPMMAMVNLAQDVAFFAAMLI